MNKRIIHTVFENQVKRRLSEIAIEEENRSITYDKLNANANQLAHLLRDIAVTREKVVGVLVPASIDLSISLLSVFKAGGVYLPIDIALTKKRIFQMLSQ